MQVRYSKFFAQNSSRLPISLKLKSKALALPTRLHTILFPQHLVLNSCYSSSFSASGTESFSLFFKPDSPAPALECFGQFFPLLGIFSHQLSTVLTLHHLQVFAQISPFQLQSKFALNSYSSSILISLSYIYKTLKYLGYIIHHLLLLCWLTISPS